MAESDVNANPMATLEPTIPNRPDEVETQLQELSLLGKDLERLLEVAKRDLEEITTQVDLGERKVERLREFIHRVHQNRMTVLERRDTCEKLRGSVLPDYIRAEVGNIEFATLKAVAGMEGLITDILTERGQHPSAIPHFQAVATTQSDTTPSVVPHDERKSYGARLAEAASTTRKTSTRSSKQEGSKRTSSSAARKLKLLTERAELEVNAQFDKEQDARTRRLITRNARKESIRREEESIRREEDIITELDDKTIERDEAVKRQRALINAKIEVIDSMEEGVSQKGASVGPAVTEVSSEDKVAAYVGASDDPIPLTVPTQLGSITNDLANTHFPTEFTGHPHNKPVETIPTKLVVPSITVEKAFLSETNKQNQITMGSLLDRFNQTLRDQNQFLEQTMPDFPLNLPAEDHPLPTLAIPFSNPVGTPYTQPITRTSKVPRIMNIPKGLTENPRAQTTQRLHPPRLPVESTRMVTKTAPHNRGVETPNAVNFEISPPGDNEMFSFDDRHMPLEYSPRRPFPDRIHTHLPSNKRSQTAVFGQNRLQPTIPSEYGGERLTSSTPDSRPANTNDSGIRRGGQSMAKQEADSDNNGHNETKRMLGVMCGQMALSRVPMGPPDIFDGKDPLSFPLWRIAFDALVNNAAMSATDKLNVLNRSLGGAAKAAVQGYLMLEPDKAYEAAYKQLIRRYGNKVSLGNSFRDRLRAWPRISGTDNTGLRNYVDYLQQCRSAMSSFKNLSILNNESENADMLEKLPVWLARKWSRKVSAQREENEVFPSFSDFVDFLDREDRIAHDPITRAFSKGNNVKNQIRGGSFVSEGYKSAGVGSNFGTCGFCRERHAIHVCDTFQGQVSGISNEVCAGQPLVLSLVLSTGDTWPGIVEIARLVKSVKDVTRLLCTQTVNVVPN